MPIRDDVAEYFRNYDRESFNVFAAGPNAPTATDIDAFEQRIGFRLPYEFRQFTMSQLGGVYIEAQEELWPRAKPFDVGPFWSFLYGVAVFGISEDVPEWLDLRVQYDAFVADGVTGLVPILKVVGDADRYCVTRTGTIVHWRHDEPDAVAPFDGTFSDLLLREVADLEGRLARKLQQRSTPH